MKLLVTGANGFIGGEVCKVAVAAGYDVVGVSRSGPPELDEAWPNEVTWVKADVLEAKFWNAHLEGCEAVVHSIGILRERPNEGVTFASLNGDTAIAAAKEAERAGVGAFVFISASATPPGVSEAYLEHKRRAERDLEARSFRPVILRPSLVYGSRRPLSTGLGKTLEAVQKLPFVSDAERPLPVETLAEATLEAIRRPDVRGVLSVAEIERLAGRGSS